MFFSVPAVRAVKSYHLDIPSSFADAYAAGSRYTLFYGGRGGGKSHAVARMLLLEGLTRNIKVLCARATQVSIAESVHALLKDIIIDNKLPYSITHNRIRYRGTSFIFKGLEGAHNMKGLKSLEGADICWVEEAQFITKDTFDTLIPTIRKKNSRFICTLNPRLETDPFYQLIHSDRKDVTAVKSIYSDNTFLSLEAYKEAEFLKETNYKEWLHVYGGELTPDDHCVFAHLEVYEDTIAPSAIQSRTACIDPAFGGDDHTAISLGFLTSDDILWVVPFAFHCHWQEAVSYMAYLLQGMDTTYYEGKNNEMIEHHLATIGVPSRYIVTTQNKQLKILQSSSYFAIDKVRYMRYSGEDTVLQEAYAKAVRHIKEWHKKAKVDDAPDCVAMLINEVRNG